VLAHLRGRAGPRTTAGPTPLRREPRWPAAIKEEGEERGWRVGAKSNLTALGRPPSVSNSISIPTLPRGIVVFRTCGTFLQLFPQGTLPN